MEEESVLGDDNADGGVCEMGRRPVASVKSATESNVRMTRRVVEAMRKRMRMINSRGMLVRDASAVGMRGGFISITDNLYNLLTKPETQCWVLRLALEHKNIWPRE